MYLTRLAIHIFYLAVALLPLAEQETEEITKSPKPVVVSLEHVLENLYQQYSDPKFNSVDVRYGEIVTNFPYPFVTRYVINGEDRRRDSYYGAEGKDLWICTYINGRTTNYWPNGSSASIELPKTSLQDDCSYLLRMGIPLSDELRADASNHFPETLRDSGLEWKLDDTYWLLNGHECFRITNKYNEEFFVDPQIGYSFRRKRLDVGFDAHFSDFKKVSNKWMPFTVKTTGRSNETLTVQSLEFGVSKSLEVVFAPGTLVTDDINEERYFLDANGKRQDVMSTIDEAKGLLPIRGSFRWLIGGIIVAVLVGYLFYWIRNRKKSH